MCDSIIEQMLIVRLGGAGAASQYGDLSTFIDLSMTRLNRTGPLTSWVSTSPAVVQYFADIIVSWSLIMAWQSKASEGAAENNPAYASKSSTLAELCRIEGDSFRLAHDKISETKRTLRG